MPHFERTFEQAGPDLTVIAVNAGFNDSVQDIAAYQRELGLRMPMVRDDGSLAAAFHLRVTPQHVVIGRDGRILHIGHLTDSRLEAALAAARTASMASPGAAPSAAIGAAVAQRYRIGDVLPAVGVATIDGPSIALRDPAGSRPTVLVFLSPWCESYLATSRPQRAADCRLMRERVAAAAGRSGVRWVGIAAGLWATPQDLRDYRRKHRVAMPLALDETGELFRSFDVADVPAAFAVDRGGRLRRRLAAADLASAAAFAQAIEAP
jgi:peroxiredoxin